MTHVYSFCGLVIQSSLRFPELRSAEKNVSPDYVFTVTDRLCPELSALVWEPLWDFPDGTAVVSKSGSIYRFESIHGPRFFIDPDRSAIECVDPSGADDTVRHLFADQVMPRVLSHQGAMMMHGACVEIGEQSVVFFGESGRGKSTLAYSLQRLGCRVLSDDCIQLRKIDNGFEAIPTYPSLRLWPEVISDLAADESTPVANYNSKRRVEVGAVDRATGPTNVSLGIVLLSDRFEMAVDDRAGGNVETSEPSHIRLAKLGKQAVVVELLRQSFHLDLRDRGLQQRSFEQVEQLALALPFKGLTYRRGLRLMPQVAQEIVQCVGQARPGS